MTHKVVGIIPARLASTRLPEKVLRRIGGKPLIQHVYENAKKASRLDALYVACDDLKIQEVVRSFGGEAWLTGRSHGSGTERICEVVPKVSCDLVVNIQGDEPLIDPKAIDELIEAFSKGSRFEVATLAVPKEDREEYLNPNVVKVVRDREGFALYFSRSPIPCSRDGRFEGFLKHLGIYAYRRDFLLRWSQLKPSLLEQTERLEQLRLLENGCKIKVLLTDKDSIGVDSEDDVRRVEKILRVRGESVWREN